MKTNLGKKLAKAAEDIETGLVKVVEGIKVMKEVGQELKDKNDKKK